MYSCSNVGRFDEAASSKELLLGQKVLEEDKADYVKGISDALEIAKNFEAVGAGAGENEDLYPVITFLGTGSSVPSKYRNVTGILVETEPGSYIILDCGEGTLGQMVRLHGVEVIVVTVLPPPHSHAAGHSEDLAGTEVCLHQPHARRPPPGSHQHHPDEGAGRQAV